MSVRLNVLKIAKILKQKVTIAMATSDSKPECLPVQEYGENVELKRANIKCEVKLEAETNETKLSNSRNAQEVDMASSKSERDQLSEKSEDELMDPPETKRNRRPGNALTHRRKYIYNDENISASLSPGNDEDPGCELCGVENLTPSKVLGHVQSHVGAEYVRKCPNFPQCSLAFCHRFALRKHLDRSPTCRRLLETGNIPLDSPSYVSLETSALMCCDICGLRFWGFEYLREHLHKTHEMIIKFFPCPLGHCSKQFSVGQSLEVHLLLEHDASYRNSQKATILQQCSKCLLRLKASEMVVHLQTIHQVGEVIRCDQCPYLFSSREELCDHLQDAHRHSDEPFYCDICENGFPELVQLRQHYFETHRVGQKWCCNQCPEYFWTEDHLKKHARQKHYAIKCLLCEEKGIEISFHSEAALRNHKIKNHDDDPYVCQKCKSQFPTELQLKNHMKQKHLNGSRRGPWECRVPGCQAKKKVYSSRSGYKHHQLTHHGNLQELSPNVCRECGKPYTSPKSLEQHFNAVHLGKQAFECDQCEMKLCSRSALKRHKMIHAGQKPEVCQVCLWRFRQASDLRDHMKQHEDGSNSRRNYTRRSKLNQK